MEWPRENADFESSGTRCAAWLYCSEGPADPPVVVMAHGFGLTRRMGLTGYAGRFAKRGIAVLLFDYRGFGDSDGEHRNVVDPSRHVEDWRAAVDHARGLPSVNGDRLGVWGTSFSGGHALVTAARADAHAYVGQMPYYGDPPSVLDRLREQGIGYVVRAGSAMVRNLVRSYTSRSPYYLPLVGQPSEAPIFPGAEEGFRSLVPENLQEEEWNRCAARIGFLMANYQPREYAPDVDCPVFVIQATRDQLVSADAIAEVVQELDDVKHLQLDCGHFDAYTGDLFDRVVDRQTAFFERHLQDS